jgi:hypothetical protein
MASPKSQVSTQTIQGVEQFYHDLSPYPTSVTTLWVDILNTVGSIEKDGQSDYPPNLENIMEGIGCYDSEAILDFLQDLVSNNFLAVNDDCWYLTEKGSEFFPFI